MKKYLLICLVQLFSTYTYALQTKSDEIAGYWKTISEKTHKPECIIAVYPYEDKYFGRIMVTYNPDGSIQDTIFEPHKRAPGVVGNPYYAGLDIIWGLKKQKNTYTYGTIMDPEKGRLYRSELWREGENLIVCGKWFIFWRNQTWLPAFDEDFPAGFQKPELATLVPVISKTIK